MNLVVYVFILSIKILIKTHKKFYFKCFPMDILCIFNVRKCLHSLRSFRQLITFFWLKFQGQDFYHLFTKIFYIGKYKKNCKRLTFYQNIGSALFWKNMSVHLDKLHYSNFQSAYESDVRSRLIKEPAQAKEKQKTEPK